MLLYLYQFKNYASYKFEKVMTKNARAEPICN